MAAYTVQHPSKTGAILSHASVGGSDTFLNDGRTFLSVKNGSGAPLTVTIKANVNICSFGHAGTGHDLVDTVAAGDEKMIGPFDKARHNDSSNIVTVTYGATSSITAAAISF